MPTAAEILVSKRAASKKGSAPASDSNLVPSAPPSFNRHKEEGGQETIPLDEREVARTNISLNMFRDISASNNALNNSGASTSIATIDGGDRNLEVKAIFKSLVQSLQYQTMISRESESAIGTICILHHPHMLLAFFPSSLSFTSHSLFPSFNLPHRSLLTLTTFSGIIFKTATMFAHVYPFL
jgi:hypothetical protein